MATTFRSALDCLGPSFLRCPSIRLVDSSIWSDVKEAGEPPFSATWRQRRGRSTLFVHLQWQIAYCSLFSNCSYSPGGFVGHKRAIGRIEGDFTCTVEVQRAIPVLKKAYGDSMRKVLHVGPYTCPVVSKLEKKEETEAWGIEPYDIEDVDGHCQSLVQKGTVRVADIKFPLLYRPNSFSLVIVSDALDYLSPRYLNKTLPDLARVSMRDL